MQYKLIACDMDGTLLNADKHLSTDNINWLQRARAVGIEPTIATGRHRNTMLEPYARALDIRVPMVTLNGSQMIHPDGSIVSQHALAQSDVAWLHQLAHHDDADWLAFTSAQFMSTDEELALRMEDRDTAWLKFVFRCPDEAGYDRVLHALTAHGGFEISSAVHLHLEVNPAGIHKAFGLQSVCAALGIEPHEVIAIGDGWNDIHMLKWAGLGIAMGNASDKVKAEADMVTDSCEESGVAKAIERILERFGPPSGK